MSKVILFPSGDYQVTVETDIDEGRLIATEIVSYNWPDGAAVTAEDLDKQGFIVYSLRDCQEELDRYN